MGGGGGFFAPIVQVIGDVVNGVSGALGGSDNVMNTPASMKQDAQKAAEAEQQRVAEEQAKIDAENARIAAENAKIDAAKADSDARLQGDALSTAKNANAAQEGGTPTAMAQTKGAAGSAAALSQSQQAVNQSSGSGTLLTGPAGVDPMSLELGRKTLLGG